MPPVRRALSIGTRRVARTPRNPPSRAPGPSSARRRPRTRILLRRRALADRRRLRQPHQPHRDRVSEHTMTDTTSVENAALQPGTPDIDIDIDIESIRAKYAAERDRRIRPEGNAQY